MPTPAWPSASATRLSVLWQITADNCPVRSRLGPPFEHRVVGAFDRRNCRALVRELLVSRVHKHRGVRFKHDDGSLAIERAVDPPVIEPDRVAYRTKDGILTLAKDHMRSVEKYALLVLHPCLMGHVRLRVVDHPLVVDREVVGQDIAIDEHEAIFSEVTVSGAIVDVL